MKLVPVNRDKIARMSIEFLVKFEIGQVHFLEGASFLTELEEELLSFPRGKHDDQVDSISLALANAQGGYDSTFAWVE